MRILVLGGSGMAGHIISLYFKEVGYDVTVFTRKKISYCENIVGNVKDLKELERVVVNGGFNAIINAVGILNQDAENNKGDAVLINSYLPHFLSDITQKLKTRVIHMSTDCVFSGRDGNYSEHSFKDGETFYDRSKALGEIENCKDLTFRSSIIGPDINKDGIGLFNWFMKQSGTINGFKKAIWTGVTTLTLAKAMEQALKEDLTGLYNLVNNEKITKYELLKLFNEKMSGNKLNIIEDKSLVLDKSLINTRDDFSFVVPSYEVMVIEMKEWILTHRELYPHYFK
ncbi:sugar nucleotide-binding protein [Solibacillus sp. A46]|uniref:dTDP-4-dehydrorhamnose reductase n=1 Tax=Solibacillus faecavium TaxID=2762221 RepID=A0ABR8Y0Y4_9BACL|nr:sugar nucleotide-binding protein [Solibacillus faecavium]MBD8037778.1 sugar nucleotide-binding protein [Solibacillus faecavium]